MSKDNGRNTGFWDGQTTAAQAAAALGITKDQAIDAIQQLHQQRLADSGQDSAPADDES